MLTEPRDILHSLRILRHGLGHLDKGVQDLKIPVPVSQVLEKLKGGHSLANSLKHAGFPAEVISLMSQAETQGRVLDGLDLLCEGFGQRLKYQGIFLRALIYPLVVFNLMMVLLPLCVLMAYPHVKTLPSSDLLLHAILLVWQIIYYLTPIVLLLALGLSVSLGLYILGRPSYLWRFVFPVLEHLPWYRSFLQHEAAAHLIFCLRSSLGSSQTMIQGLQHLKSHPSPRLRTLVQALLEKIEAGSEVSSLLQSDSTLPLEIRMLLILAEDGSNLEAGLTQASHTLEEQFKIHLVESERIPAVVFLLFSGLITAMGLILIFYPTGKLLEL